MCTCKGHVTPPTPRLIILRDKGSLDSSQHLSSEEGSGVLNLLLPFGVTGQCF